MRLEPTTDIARILRGPYAARGSIVRWLLGRASKIANAPFMLRAPVLAGDDRDFPSILKRARAVQSLGHDVGFAMMQRFPDTPPLHVCRGMLEEKNFNIAGYDFFSPATALAKALSESLERSLWLLDENYWKRRSVRDKLLKKDHRWLDISRLSTISPHLKPEHAPLPDHDPACLWTPCARLATGERVYAPTQLVSGFYADHQTTEPHLWIPITNGLATAETFDEAALRGLHELIERDACLISYHARLVPKRIVHTSIQSADTQHVLGTFRRFGLHVDFLLTPTDMPATVVVAAVRDQRGGPALALGSKAHADPERAVLGALAESYALYLMQRGVGAYKKSLPPEPWDLAHRLAFWAKPENQEKISWFFSGEEVPLPNGENNARTARELARAAEARGCEVAAIQMSGRGEAKAGLVSVSVISPAMHQLTLASNHRHPHVARLRDMPERLGLTPGTPPSEPHPFP